MQTLRVLIRGDTNSYRNPSPSVETSLPFDCRRNPLMTINVVVTARFIPRHRRILLLGFPHASDVTETVIVDQYHCSCRFIAGIRFRTRWTSAEPTDSRGYSLPPVSEIRQFTIKEHHMSLEHTIRLIAGTFILASLGLGLWVSPYWYWFTAFVGVNLIQSSITKWCLMEDILKGLGFGNSTRQLPVTDAKSQNSCACR